MAALAALLAGCASTVWEHRNPLNEADFAPYGQEGTGAVVGAVAVRMEAGDIYRGVESFVYLIPVTPFTTEWVEHHLIRGERVGGRDPRSLRVARTATVDDDGRFQFRNLPPGDYYLTCTVTRSRPPFQFGQIQIISPSTEHVEAYARVQVRAGEETQVTVTRPRQP